MSDSDMEMLVELGVYNRCERCGEPTRYVLCDPCHAVVTEMSKRAYEAMKRRWLERGLPWPQDV